MTGVQELGTLRLGTRRSTLAMAQSGDVAARLHAVGAEVALVEVVTEGDRSSAPLATIGGTGVFVSALRERLLEGQVDLAVHSLKDLPTGPAAGIVIAAVPVREDVADVLVSRSGGLDALPPGATVGTGSPRRAAQLRRLRPDLDVVAVRGNVDTRLGRVAVGDLDAIVLAAAGLRRLGRAEEITERLEVTRMLPAPGQGALAIECRAEDTALADALRQALDDPATRAAVTAERAVLQRLEAGCSAPIGALATVDGPTVAISAVVVSLDGAEAVTSSGTGAMHDAYTVGSAVADDLLAAGAAGLIGVSL